MHENCGGGKFRHPGKVTLVVSRCFDHLGAAQQAVSITLAYYHLIKLLMPNMLSKSCLYTLNRQTEQH